MTVELSEQKIISKIHQRQFFIATINGGAFTLKMDKYLPAMSAAIHDGGNFRAELEDNCLLDKAARYFEEDPYTASLLKNKLLPLLSTIHAMNTI